MAHQSNHDDIAALPEGIFSLLDTDLYKLTMQCAVLKHYPDIDVTYHFTNRTPKLLLNRKAAEWLKVQVQKLGHIKLTDSELKFLQEKCPFLPETYLRYLQAYRFKPETQAIVSFDGGSNDDDLGMIHVDVKGKWVETILYEIPLLVLVSEAYFRFVDTDWTYDGQEDLAFDKGKTLLDHGAVFSEFGTRRRRSYHTQDLVMKGLIRADKEKSPDGSGKLTGTSNVHFAHRHNVNPIGTVAHEWFMGIASILNNYSEASYVGLQKWTDTFGVGTLAIALTDTFGTPVFLKSFAKPYEGGQGADGKTFAEFFTGVRQDSGEPEEFVKWMRKFYDDQGIKEKKMIVFSDSLNVDLVLKYKSISDSQGFNTSFGIGTFFTNDYKHASQPDKKSTPLNIVIKISSANGNPSVKISDNIGKNTGDQDTVKRVKKELGYEEHGELVDESMRW